MKTDLPMFDEIQKDIKAIRAGRKKTERYRQLVEKNPADPELDPVVKDTFGKAAGGRKITKGKLSALYYGLVVSNLQDRFNHYLGLMRQLGIYQQLVEYATKQTSEPVDGDIEIIEAVREGQRLDMQQIAELLVKYKQGDPLKLEGMISVACAWRLAPEYLGRTSEEITATANENEKDIMRHYNGLARNLIEAMNNDVALLKVHQPYPDLRYTLEDHAELVKNLKILDSRVGEIITRNEERIAWLLGFYESDEFEDSGMDINVIADPYGRNMLN